jgi:hypothetical protein
MQWKQMQLPTFIFLECGDEKEADRKENGL